MSIDIASPGGSEAALKAALEALQGKRINTATVNLTAADLLALHTTPVQILPALGAGKYPVILSVRIDVTVLNPFYAQNHAPSIVVARLLVGSSIIANTNLDGFITADSTFSFGSVGGNMTSGLNQPTMLALKDFAYDSGAVLASHVEAGGSGYAPGDNGGFNDNYTLFVVDTVDGGGAVLTYHLTDAVSLLGVQTTYNNSSGGSGFTVNVTSIQEGSGSAVVTVQYIEA